MKISSLYFSPTGTTRRVIDAVIAGIGSEGKVFYDVTHAFQTERQLLSDGVVIIGAPVYAGRIPEDFLKRMKNYHAAGLPTVLVVLYGNREFEDALVELRDVATAQGFNVIAAGRPDGDDLAVAFQFGQQVVKKIECGDLSTPEISGDVPYRERVKFGGIAPTTVAERCVLCGECAGARPVNIVTVTSTGVETVAERCIMCSACT